MNNTSRRSTLYEESRAAAGSEVASMKNELTSDDIEKKGQNLDSDDVQNEKGGELEAAQRVGDAANPDDSDRWTARLTLAGAWLIQFCGFGYSNAFGVYEDFYVREFLINNTSSQISWIGSTQLFIMMSFGLISGRLFDKGYFYPLMITGTTLLSFCIFMLSLAKPGHFYQVFLSQGLGAGLATGITYVPSIAVLAQHYTTPHHKALAMAIAASGSSTGGLLHPIMLNNLFHHGLGFANGVRASAGLLAGVQIIALALMRPKYKKHADGQEKKHVEVGTLLKKILKDPAYVCSVLGMTSFFLGIFFPIFFLQLYAIVHGLNPDFAFYSLSILNAASMVGRILPGFFVRSIGVLNIVTFVGLGCSVLVFALFGVKTTAAVGVFAALYGLFSGAYVSMINPMIAMLTDDPAELGARMGFSFVFTGIAGLIGAPIAGALLGTVNYTWWRPILFSGILGALGVSFFVVLRIIVGRRKGGVWVT